MAESLPDAGTRLLIVDDDRMLVEYICTVLQEDGHAVDVARDVREGRYLAGAARYRGIILDVMLPDGTGYGLLRELREQGNDTPVLMLTSRDREEDVVEGLDAGADDYLRKPFQPGELKARVRAILRRSGVRQTEETTLGGLRLDRLRRTVTAGAQRLKLTPKEYTLLEYFMLNPDRVISRSELLAKVWDIHFDPGSNVVDTHIARLRAKLERVETAAQLTTVRGSGFMLTAGTT